MIQVTDVAFVINQKSEMDEPFDIDVATGQEALINN